MTAQTSLGGLQVGDIGMLTPLAPGRDGPDTHPRDQLHLSPLSSRCSSLLQPSRRPSACGQTGRPAPCASHFARVQKRGPRCRWGQSTCGPPTCGQSGEHLQGLIWVSWALLVNSNYTKKEARPQVASSLSARLTRGRQSAVRDRLQ